MVSDEEAARRQAETLARAGDALLAAEKRTEAILQYQRASVFYADLQMKPELGSLKLRIGEAFLALGLLEEAGFFLRQAHDLLLGWGGPVELGRCYYALAHCHERSGREEEARKSLEAAAFMFEKAGESQLAAEARAAAVPR